MRREIAQSATLMSGINATRRTPLGPASIRSYLPLTRCVGLPDQRRCAGPFAMLMRRALSRVSKRAADRRPGTALRQRMCYDAIVQPVSFAGGIPFGQLAPVAHGSRGFFVSGHV
jgi:hypothetical protein